MSDEGKDLSDESERIDREAIRREGWWTALRKYFAGSRFFPVWKGDDE